jgi:hypothetical protein
LQGALSLFFPGLQRHQSCPTTLAKRTEPEPAGINGPAASSPACVGPNPTDWGDGRKRNLLVDARGIPLSLERNQSHCVLSVIVQGRLSLVVAST